MSLFNELKRRNVFRVAVAYVVIGWLLIQVVELAADSFEAPVWVMKMIIALVAIGFIPTLLFSWAFELTPEGIKKDSEVKRNDSITDLTAKKLNVITLIAAVVVTALVIWQQMNPSYSRIINETDKTLTAAPTTIKPQNAVSEKSIAVLAFVNMSADSNQDYFADGISEEILNALVKATGLRVAGRTSSFSFKGKDVTIKHIGELLNVAYVLEGSVRKQNQSVRITAQLIKADDGFHLWSETYDGSLENIFDLQEDISRKVTEQLKLILNLGAEQRLASKMTNNIDAYDLFLRGREKVRKRIATNIPEGIALLHQAVELDPNFAEAWAKLAEAEAVSHGYVTVDWGLTTARALSHIKQALEINSSLALPYAVKGLIELDQTDFLSAIKFYNKALNMEPNNLLAIRWLGNTYSMLGLDQMALPLFEQAYVLDPLSSIDTFNLGAVHFKLGNLEQALRFLKISDEIRGVNILNIIAHIYYHQGLTKKAIDFYLAIYKKAVYRSGPQGFISQEQAEIQALAYFGGTDEQKQAAINIGQTSFRKIEVQFGWQIKYLLALDKIDRAYEILDQNPSLFSGFASDDMWFPIPVIKTFRSDPRFIKLLEKYKLPIAWQKLGWPKYCQPHSGTDGSNGQFQCH
ncbi:MAG: hypothetical protein COA74_11945 [Gammaproteobacteria bacterium]|nr:MAG: hypothetical protein COA74_11945 [Gammaproteobacteria bacterium]